MELLSAAFHGRRTSDPPYTSFLATQRHEAPWAPQVPVRRKALDAERSGWERNGVGSPILHIGRPALRFLRFVIADQVANAGSKFGGVGTKLPSIAHSLEPIISESKDTDPRNEKVQNAAWPQLPREKGDVGSIRDERTKLHRERLTQCVRDGQSEFFENPRTSFQLQASRKMPLASPATATPRAVKGTRPASHRAQKPHDGTHGRAGDPLARQGRMGSQKVRREPNCTQATKICSFLQENNSRRHAWK